MKFLLNMNIPPVLSHRLIALGHECRHARDIGMTRAMDVAILEEARAQHEVILTHDLDYGDLLAFSSVASPSVIIFRLQNTHPNNLIERFSSAWSEMALPLKEGAIVVMEDAALRVRRLPILKEEESA